LFGWIQVVQTFTLGYGSVWAFDGHIDAVENHQSVTGDVNNASDEEGEHSSCDHCCHASAHLMALWSSQQSRANLIATSRIYQTSRLAWKTWEASGAPSLSQRTDLLDRLWQAGELSTTDYLVQLKQALDTEVSAIEQQGRMWRAWADWLAASGQVDRWLNLAGDKQ